MMLRSTYLILTFLIAGCNTTRSRGPGESLTPKSKSSSISQVASRPTGSIPKLTTWWSS